MKNLLIISSKKYLSKKISNDIFKILDKGKFNYETQQIETLEDKNYNNKKIDLVISIGGDGTALKAMRVAWKLNKPLINIGPGRLGYLVSSQDNLQLLLKKWQSRNFESVERKAIIQNNDQHLPSFNEVVIIKNSPTRILDLEIETYQQKVKLRADGIILSTSLGSTAYNYSAGGPIIQNDINVISITPISPFSKFPRSIVVNKDTLIDISIIKNQNYAIQFDGVTEIQENNSENSKYSYSLSNKSVKILGTDNDPKLELFLNQILR